MPGKSNQMLFKKGEAVPYRKQKPVYLLRMGGSRKSARIKLLSGYGL